MCLSLTPCAAHSELCGIWDFHKSELCLLVVDVKESAGLMVLPGAVPLSGELWDRTRWGACISSREVAEEVWMSSWLQSTVVLSILLYALADASCLLFLCWHHWHPL